MSADIVLVRDFTDCPAGRMRAHGPGSGEEFREDFLRPALVLQDEVTVDLNGADSLPPAFLDEAFGPLAAELGQAEFYRRVRVILDDDETAVRKLSETIALRAENGFPAN